VLCARSKEECDRVLSQLKIVIRTNYSNPPTHGGAVVAAVLNNPELRALWEKELGEMRVRIKAMRQKLVDGLKAAGVKQDMSFITTQIGMFSYSGLSKDQMVRLRSEFGVYGTDTGRMCVAALNSKNIDYVCACIAKVICPRLASGQRALRAQFCQPTSCTAPVCRHTLRAGGRCQRRTASALHGHRCPMFFADRRAQAAVPRRGGLCDQFCACAASAGQSTVA
jgi:hypothetical protein